MAVLQLYSFSCGIQCLKHFVWSAEWHLGGCFGDLSYLSHFSYSPSLLMIGEHCLEFSRVLFFFLSCCYNVIFSVSWIIWNGFSFSGGFLKHLSPPSETFEPNYSAVCWTPFVSSCGFYRKWGKGNIANSCQIKLCRPGELLIMLLLICSTAQGVSALWDSCIYYFKG